MSSQPTFQRAKHDREHPFLMTSRKTIRDAEISFGARGLLIYLLSFPDDWVVLHSHIIKTQNIGGKALSTLINELMIAGYCQRSRERLSNGQWGPYNYFLSEFKIFLPDAKKESGNNNFNPLREAPLQDSLNQTPLAGAAGAGTKNNSAIQEESASEENAAATLDSDKDPNSEDAKLLVKEVQDSGTNIKPVEIERWIKYYGVKYTYRTIAKCFIERDLKNKSNAAAYVQRALSDNYFEYKKEKDNV